jgi:hypothetical protein
MAEAAPTETSSTPTTAAAAPVTAPATDTTQTATPAATAATSETTPSTAPSEPAKTDSTPVTTAATADTAPKTDATQATAPVKPTFTLPTDMKLGQEAVTKFTDFVASKADAEGKVTLTAQELVDLYADQARGANQRWQTQLAAQDSKWEAESKSRFTAPQLAAAETGIGFLTSYEPTFRDLAKSFRNNPSFVNAMRIVGERLSEDTFETGSATPPTTQKTRAERMGYVKAKTN